MTQPRPINPLSEKLQALHLAQSEPCVPVPTYPALKTVAGGQVLRRAADKTARIVTAPAGWLHKPLFRDTEPPAVHSHELELLRKEVRQLNGKVEHLSALLTKERLNERQSVAQATRLAQQCAALVSENRNLKNRIGQLEKYLAVSNLLNHGD